MRRQYLALIAFASLLGPSACKAGVLEEFFTFGEVKIGTTTLAEAQTIYGDAKSSRTSKEDGAPIAVCYFFIRDKEKVFVALESGAMGGWERVTSLRLSKKSLGNDCSQTKGNIAIDAGGGVRIADGQRAFKQKFGGVSFKQTSRGLAYVGETKRTATSDEVKRMKSAHPKETQIEFDVVVTINAKFDSNRLADYRISKMESF